MNEILNILGVITAITILIGASYRFYKWLSERWREHSERRKKHSEASSAISRYVSSLIEDLSLWRGLGLGRDVHLEQLYVSQFLRKDSQNINDTEFLQCLLNKTFQKCLIIGRAGSGKTTLLKNLALRVANTYNSNNSNLQEKWVPVYLSLGEITYLFDKNTFQNLSLIELIASLFPNSTGKISQSLSEGLVTSINSGKLIIFLDGADEVPENLRPHIKQWLKKVQHSIGECPIVLTSRPSIDYLADITGFEEFNLKDFEMDQIESFIKKWFSNNDQTISATNLIEEIKHKPRLKIMASNPLFLTMMCIEFECEKIIPYNFNVAILFERFIRILLRDWDRERGVRRSCFSTKIPIDIEIRLLGHIASNFFGYINFSEDELVKYVRKLFQDWKIKEFQPDEILKEIENTSGIIVRGPKGSYRFCHPLFQEFFVAKNVIEQVKEGKLNQEKWIEGNFFKKEFENIIAFFHELQNQELQ